MSAQFLETFYLTRYPLCMPSRRQNLLAPFRAAALRVRGSVVRQVFDDQCQVE